MPSSIPDLESRIHNLEILVHALYSMNRQILPENVRHICEGVLSTHFASSEELGAFKIPSFVDLPWEDQ